jgi:hypothetical protein
MGRLVPPKVAGDVLMYRDISRGRGWFHWCLSVIAFDKYLHDRVLIYGIPTNEMLNDELLKTKIGFYMTLDKSKRGQSELKLVVSYPPKRGGGGAKGTYSYLAATDKEGESLFRRIKGMIMKNRNSYDELYSVAKYDIPKMFKKLGRPRKTPKKSGILKKTDRVSGRIPNIRGALSPKRRRKK